MNADFAGCDVVCFAVGDDVVAVSVQDVLFFNVLVVAVIVCDIVFTHLAITLSVIACFCKGVACFNLGVSCAFISVCADGAFGVCTVAV